MRGGLDEDRPIHALDDAAMLGMPPEAREALRAEVLRGRRQAGFAGVWAINAAAVEAFAACATQWRAVGLGLGGFRFTGLDYAGCRAGLECLGTAVTPGLWRDLQIMEAAALDEFDRD